MKAPSNTGSPVGWKGMGSHQHFVQFFDQDAVLIDSVCGFLGGGLLAGDACIVFATAEHRRDIERGLAESGFDLESARGWNQYVAFDAREALSKFMVDGLPDPAKFDALVEPIVARAGQRHERVLAFGEMVALLSLDGRHDAAIELEKLWNRLAKRHRFSLFCAYPVAAFHGDGQAQALADVCAEHSAVISSAKFGSSANVLDLRSAV